jgi:hypothetical protein
MPQVSLLSETVYNKMSFCRTAGRPPGIQIFALQIAEASPKDTGIFDLKKV